LDITILDVGNVASRAGVGLDSCAVLTVEHFTVFEQDVGDIVVALREVRRRLLMRDESLTLPPTLPIERPCPPSQYMFETVMLLPLVIATQSSWFNTLESLKIMPSVLEISKPSVL